MTGHVHVAVVASGGGTNLQSLLDTLNGTNHPAARVTQVISNRKGAGALERARQAGVPTHVIADPTSATEYIEALGDAQLVVLAGYLKLIPATVVSRFRWRMVNIHPALLPEFGGPGMYGIRVHEAVLAAGVKESGASVHYVTEEYDRQGTGWSRYFVCPGCGKRHDPKNRVLELGYHAEGYWKVDKC